MLQVEILQQRVQLLLIDVTVSVLKNKPSSEEGFGGDSSKALGGVSYLVVESEDVVELAGGQFEALEQETWRLVIY